ncbi:MAG TPA: primosomal protein N', partial [Aquabacterium sp.]|nr:primosomal protein N' [Aquabacterium sp.]
LGPLDYRHGQALPAGSVVRVPLGRRTVTGVVWDEAGAVSEEEAARTWALQDLKPLVEVLPDLPPLPDTWRQLVRFAATYYQRSLGEMAMMVLPPELRQLDAVQWARRVKRLRKSVSEGVSAVSEVGLRPDLTPEQGDALDALAAREAGQAHTVLLWGSTGSGKTEVYLRRTEQALDAGQQVLMMVPEINLTPQLEARVAARFAGRVIVSLHSGLTPAQRLRHWMLAHLGLADIVLGTRLAVFTPMPRLGLVVVDEEHDPSYKQQDGARYSARDLAIYRGHLERVGVILGSATPSLETWYNAMPVAEGGSGRYLRLHMPSRVGQGAMPKVRLLDLTREPKPLPGREAPPLSRALLDALALRHERGEQSLVLLNRRGYAPVLQCSDCGWKSACPHCSAWRVF